MVIHDGDQGEDAWGCDYVAYYTAANLYDDETDTEPAISCPYDGGSLITGYAAQEHGVVVFSNFMHEHSRMLVST